MARPMDVDTDETTDPSDDGLTTAERGRDALRLLLSRFRTANPRFRIADSVIRRYHLSMATRGFVILAGASGTGKTWLAQAYAEAVGARAKLVAVDPSWSSNEDLLGYLSPLDGFYHHTPFSEFVQEAAREWTAADMAGRSAREFHVILDEMNLARVEHYFAEVLSAMETPTRELLLPDGCPAPCFMGIRPGITTMDEAVAILEASHWVGQIEKESGGFGDTINWTWNNRVPRWIIPTSSGQLRPTQNPEKPLVDTITIYSFLQLGEVYALLGRPDTEKLDFAGFSIGERYAYIGYVALYNKEKLFLTHEQACRTGYEDTGTGESAGVPFTMPVRIVMGDRLTLPVSGEPIPIRSPIHLRHVCRS